jgi:hypothetical protein
MTAIGALNEYLKDYTECVNRCDFYNTDKTKRLGYDNNLCLLKCNSFYTYLRKNHIPSHGVYFADESGPRRVIKIDDTCGNDLKCMEQNYQKNECKKQCYLNQSFFSPYRLKRCFYFCDSARKQNF